jgi:hypothetical protein
MMGRKHLIQTQAQQLFDSVDPQWLSIGQLQYIFWIFHEILTDE